MPLLPRIVCTMPIMPRHPVLLCVHHQRSAAATCIKICISAGCCVKTQKMSFSILAGRDPCRHVHSREPACTPPGARAPAAALLPGRGGDRVWRQRPVIHSPGAQRSASGHHWIVKGSFRCPGFRVRSTSMVPPAYAPGCRLSCSPAAPAQHMLQDLYTVINAHVSCIYAHCPLRRPCSASHTLNPSP